MLTGWAWGPDAESIKWIGDFFIKAIKMLVVPLIFFSLYGVAAIGDLRKLGAVGARAAAVRRHRADRGLARPRPRHADPAGCGADTSAIQMGETPVKPLRSTWCFRSCPKARPGDGGRGRVAADRLRC